MKSTKKVAHSTDRAKKPRANIAEQLQRRLDALQNFMDGDREYIVEVSDAPSSLGVLRTWSLPALNIEPIASKASTDLRLTGTEASKVLLQKLLELMGRIKALKKATATRPRKPTRDEQIQRLKVQLKQAEDDRDSATAHYHEIAHLLETELKKERANTDATNGLKTELKHLQKRFDSGERASPNDRTAHLKIVPKEP